MQNLTQFIRFIFRDYFKLHLGKSILFNLNARADSR